MLKYPNINPIALQIGPVKIHWYGLMYLLGFASAWFLANYRAKKQQLNWTSEQISDLIFWAAIGVVVGGRFGYMLFYNFHQWIQAPLSIFYVWQGGMSFHGGLIGVVIALLLFAKASKRSFFEVGDFVAPLVPIGLAAGRLGNFINGELWGRVTDVPWAMVFPSGGPLPRHPSQLYEFGLEGVALFIILWFFTAKPRPKGAASGVFLIAYGCFRFFVEFFRQPDAGLDFIAFNWLTMGQLLSIPMVALGAVIIFCAYRHTRGIQCNSI